MQLQSETVPIQFGSPSTRWSERSDPLELAVPVLAGDPGSRLPFDLGRASRQDHWRIWGQGSILCAVGVLPVVGAPSVAASQLYKEAFRIAGARSLYRFWNFIPRINQETDRLENYRSFGLGRHDAFVARFGVECASRRMPAATGVGVDDDVLVVALLAGYPEPEHLENPNQVPAYAYPGRYGPRPPSFARATRVEVDGTRCCFLAGTSSVLGHESIGVGDLPYQTKVTLANIETMGGRMGLPESLGRGQGLRRMFRIYLRRAEDLERIRSTVEDQLLEEADQVVWLKSAICRADLDIEIEATIVG